MPTEWIHHPWNAPLSVLRASGVELGQNYPNPIIDIDLAREKLTQAIFKMWEIQAASKASSSEARDEVVVDSEYQDIPKVVVLKDKAPCATISANDQKVPALHVQDPKNDLPIRKRTKCMAEKRKNKESSENHEKDSKVSSTDQDTCSTADSSACKKQCSTSTYSFSVPQQCSSSSNLKWLWQEQIDMEQSSGKDGKHAYISKGERKEKKI
jgi:cryptochrome 2